MISIITATYNRSNVLLHAIRSVLRSDYQDWELIVVGDCCTDDTSDVVASFADPRIRFHNLDENFGDQSGPNNVGFRMSTGEFVAYLNHDDLYFPDHLGSSLACLERSGADFVHSAALRCHPVGRDESMRMRLTVHAVSNSGRYNPLASVPATTWLVRREMIEAVGPWKPASQCHESSSQDWLFRAWKTGRTMVFNPRVTVLIIPSGIRRDDYARREDRDIRAFDEAMLDPGFRERQLEEVAIASAAAGLSARLSPIHHLRSFGHFTYLLLARFLMRLGVPPRRLLRFLAFGRRGAFIDHLRKRRGLDPIDAEKQRTARP